MQELFTFFSKAIEGNAPVAITAAFVWGILSIVLSPCHLASIPLIVGFIDEQGRTSTVRAFYVSSLFAGGILVTIAVIGVITAFLGSMVSLGAPVYYLMALVFLAVGLHLIGVIPMPFSGPGNVGLKRRGPLAALILGLLFGVALGPCTFAFMAPILGVTFALGGTEIAYGAVLLTAYGVGHCSVIVIAGTSTEMVQRYLDWNERSRGAEVVKIVCGVLVILGGLYLIWTAP